MWASSRGNDFRFFISQTEQAMGEVVDLHFNVGYKALAILSELQNNIYQTSHLILSVRVDMRDWQSVNSRNGPLCEPHSCCCRKIPSPPRN